MVTSLSPSSGPRSGANIVEVSGSGFTPSPVTVDAQPIVQVTVVSSALLRIVMPAFAPSSASALVAINVDGVNFPDAYTVNGGTQQPVLVKPQT